MLRRLFLLWSFFSLTTALFAQSSPSAEGHSLPVWVGGAISWFNPDYGCSSSSPFSCGGHQLIGPTIYAELPHLFINRIGVASEFRFMHWNGPAAGLNEDTYLFGPQVRVWSFGRVDLNGKFLIGNGHISIPDNGVGQGNYLVYAPVFGAVYRATPRLSVRLEYEYQMWPSFQGMATSFTSGTGGITPNGFTVGVNYRLFPR